MGGEGQKQPLKDEDFGLNQSELIVFKFHMLISVGKFQAY